MANKKQAAKASGKPPPANPWFSGNLLHFGIPPTIQTTKTDASTCKQGFKNLYRVNKLSRAEQAATYKHIVWVSIKATSTEFINHSKR